MAAVLELADAVSARHSLCHDDHAHGHGHGHVLEQGAITESVRDVHTPEREDVMSKRANATVYHDLNEKECDTTLERSPTATVKTDNSPELENKEVSEKTPRTAAMKKKENWHIFALCFALFVAGWDGGTAGPLILRMQEYYNVSYTIISVIFIANCVGFLLGAAMNVFLTDRLGFGKVLALGSFAQLVGYALLAPALPFPVFCIAFVINGWGISLQDAQSNGYVASLTENSSMKMGLLHAFYGIGAVCSPFSATQFATLPRIWSYHFIISAGLAIINTAILLAVFKGRDQDTCLQSVGEEIVEAGTSEHSKYRQMFNQKNLHLLAFFSLVYVGIEFTIASWTVTYIVEHRSGGASSGYISTGFFGGLAIGRVALLWINEKVGEHLIIYAYIVISLALELVVWFVPSLIGNAVAVSMIGFFLGPMYPILMNETGKLLPPWLLTGSIGWIASFGFAGSALFPFLTGAFSGKFGIVSLQPLLVAMMGLLFVIWLITPSGDKKKLS